jgi:hypothetical protein
MDVCFDINLKDFEDVNFFLISSKNNIIINLKGKFYCYTRGEITKIGQPFTYKGNTYYAFPEASILHDILIDEASFRYLSYRRYVIYKFIKSEKRVYYNPIYTVESYTLDDFME